MEHIVLKCRKRTNQRQILKQLVKMKLKWEMNGILSSECSFFKLQIYPLILEEDKDD